mmetsp:Transcript_106936/g.312719  ORF Transcript_106936/g.312719 Transcript_106936/m.312719 type:complete len:219 (+) Transcript_106936:89-745(+)
MTPSNIRAAVTHKPVPLTSPIAQCTCSSSSCPPPAGPFGPGRPGACGAPQGPAPRCPPAPEPQARKQRRRGSARSAARERRPSRGRWVPRWAAASGPGHSRSRRRRQQRPLQQSQHQRRGVRALPGAPPGGRLPWGSRRPPPQRHRPQLSSKARRWPGLAPCSKKPHAPPGRRPSARRPPCRSRRQGRGRLAQSTASPCHLSRSGTSRPPPAIPHAPC